VPGQDEPLAAALSPDPRTPAQRAVDDAQGRLLRAPNDEHAMGRLASAYLQRGRETGDPTYYSKADALLAVALAAAAPDPDLLVTAGSLALSRHDFAAALDWGGRAVAAAPARPAAQGVVVDALVELGRYDEAVAAAQRMVDLRPDLASYSRISYLRELHGDVAGAATLDRRATARLPLPEYVGALGDVYARLGDAGAAEREYALVDVERRLLIANGVRVDVDLALFDADHGHDLARAVEVARAEYAIRPSVHIADILAWAELRSGDAVSALRHGTEALRLGSRDPLLLYHAGVIAQATGDDERARELLWRAHDLNPRFALLWPDDLARRLDDLGPARSAP